MNSKQAKAIRSAARSMTTNFTKEANVIHKGIRKYKTRIMKDGVEKEVEVPYNTYTHVHPIGSYRNVLKKLKRNFNQTPRNFR